MAKKVKIVTFSFNPAVLKYKPQEQSIVDYEIEWLNSKIQPVLMEKPDLVVMPEVCDRPMDLPREKFVEYYEERGEKVVAYMQKIARENGCYIAHSAVRKAKDGYNRNSVQMIDRNGEIIGCYDKNYLCPPGEVDYSNCRCGKDAAIFECDFGRIGAVICYDLNFEEMRQKYKKLHPDLMLFCSAFGGGLMKNFFAFDTRSYFVSSCSYDCPAEIINPLGETIRKTTNHYNYIVETLNLDYAIVHLDHNWEKIRAAREKYPLLQLSDVGFIGVVMLTYEGTDTTAKEIVKEFDMRFADEYLDWAREQREIYLSKN